MLISHEKERSKAGSYDLSYGPFCEEKKRMTKELETQSQRNLDAHT